MGMDGHIKNMADPTTRQDVATKIMLTETPLRLLQINDNFLRDGYNMVIGVIDMNDKINKQERPA